MNKVGKLCIVILFTVILCIIISLIGIRISGAKTDETLIKKQDKLMTMGVFEERKGYSNAETDLTQIDMTYQKDVRLYRRAITNAEEYEKYKRRIPEFPENAEINFNENFIVIIVNENIRTSDEIDMIISNVYADESTTNIIMKQKENPNMNDTSNVWYAIIDKSQLRENVEITIEHKKFINEDFVELSKLPLDYSVEQAKKDGCFTIRANKVVSENKNQIDEYIEKVKQEQKGFLRVYNDNYGKITVTDVNFENGIYYVDKKIFNEGLHHGTYTELIKHVYKNGEYDDIDYMLLNGTTIKTGDYLALIQEWVSDEIIENRYKEKNQY